MHTRGKHGLFLYPEIGYNYVKHNGNTWVLIGSLYLALYTINLDTTLAIHIVSRISCIFLILSPVLYSNTSHYTLFFGGLFSIMNSGGVGVVSL